MGEEVDHSGAAETPVQGAGGRKRDRMNSYDADQQHGGRARKQRGATGGGAAAAAAAAVAAVAAPLGEVGAEVTVAMARPRT